MQKLNQGLKSMNSGRLLLAGAVIGVISILPSARSVAAPGPATAPAAAPASTQPQATASELAERMMALETKIDRSGGSSAVLSDPTKRAAAAPTVIPMLKNLLGLMDDYAKAGKLSAPAREHMKQEPTATLYLLGDPDTVTAVDTQANSTDPATSIKGQTTRLSSQWLSCGDDDVNAQNKVIDQLEKLDLAHPDNVDLTRFTFSLRDGVNSDAVASRLLSLAADKMDSKMSAALREARPRIEQARVDQALAKKKLLALESKPLTVSGKSIDGTTFTTADWKGKVVLVDFWATWCGPCRAELPRVKQMYADYHDKGLEIVSVSNDYKASALTDFIAKNGMPWPELYDDAAGSEHRWNPITLGYGINGIPTMFLIDKKGICRTVDARDKMEDLIPVLLAE